MDPFKIIERSCEMDQQQVERLSRILAFWCGLDTDDSEDEISEIIGLVFGQIKLLWHSVNLIQTALAAQSKINSTLEECIETLREGGVNLDDLPDSGF